MLNFMKRMLAPVRELGIKIGTEYSDNTTFTDVNSQIDTLYDMYMGTQKGKQLVRAIVKFRSSTIMGGGLHPIYTGEKEGDTDPQELLFIQSLIDINNVNQGLNRKLIAASEIEGQVLVKVEWSDGDEAKGIPAHAKIIYLPYKTTQYKFSVDENDPEKIVSVKYKLGSVEVDEPFDNYSFVAFNALPNAIQGYTNMGVVIQEMKDVDEALRDWRQMNRNFSSSTPVFKCETLKEAEQHQEALQKQKWSKGRALFTTADFSLVQGNAGDFESIENEIIDKVKMISAASGVPAQHLGLPDQLSNRATAENMDEPVQRIAETEEDLWATFWEKIFDISIRLNNESSTGSMGKLEFNVIEPDTTGVSSGDYAAVKDIYFPMYREGALSLEGLLEFTPNIDVEKEKRRQQREGLAPTGEPETNTEG